MKKYGLLCILSVIVLLFSCSRENKVMEQIVPKVSVKKSNEQHSIPHFNVSVLSAERQAQMSGLSMKENNQITFDDLRLVEITYINFLNETKQGELVVHRDLAKEVLEIFKEIYEAKYPIATVNPIDAYGADDQASMLANNTSAFCYRIIKGTNVLSNHAKGMAIDINPFQNPHVVNGIPNPKEALKYVNRNINEMGMIKEGDPCYLAFTKRGWTWGGHWKNPDYQHFEKIITI